jgi:hypothetical protein
MKIGRGLKKGATDESTTPFTHIATAHPVFDNFFETISQFFFRK